jgi:acetyl-CoA synthetase
MRTMLSLLFFLFFIPIGNADQERAVDLEFIEAFWGEEAQKLDWIQPWDQVLSWTPPYAKWFVGGKLNACYNCLDRHMQTEVREKVAFFWEGEKGDQKALTYGDLYYEVNRFSNVLKSMGVQKGDVVAVYLPMIPEAVIAMLSCARIGAIHNVVFSGYAVGALKDRIVDSEAKVVVTADGGRRSGKIIPLKKITDWALKDARSVEKVIVVNYIDADVKMLEGRDYWYSNEMEKADVYCPIEEMDSEDPLFVLYTSGTTGKPKGIVHTTGGYTVAVTSTTALRDSTPQDVYFSMGDLGWLAGHTGIVYGPLSIGDTQLMYEGMMDYPAKDRIWQLIEKYKVTVLTTSPTAIRMFMKWGSEWLEKYDLSTLRALGSLGEPINSEAWYWYYSQVGKENCPIIDMWGQTETGAAMIGAVPDEVLKPGSAGVPLPGMDVRIIDDEGNSANIGHVVIASPWPSMLNGVYKDPSKYEEKYWKKVNGTYYYFTGDMARIDDEGDIWFLGRSDDVVKVSGHRLSTVELEGAITSYPDVVEAAVVGVPHEVKGSSLVAFVTLRDGVIFQKEMEQLLKDHISKKIGGIAKPDRILFTKDLPKTRTGKIMRRLLRDIAEGKVIGDMSTLLDFTIVDDIKKQYEQLD